MKVLVSEGRGLKRTPARIPTTLLLESGNCRSEHQATIVDLSREGVQVQVAVPLMCGDSVGVELDEHRANARRGHVVWVEPLWPRREWRAGVKLVDHIRL